MRPFFTHCIFCRRDLTSPGASSKEHMVPEYLYGSIPMSGVCRTCNSELGRQVDILALLDPYVVKAAFHLNLPELQAQIRDYKGNRTFFRDTVDGHEIPGRSKKGVAQMQPFPRRTSLFEGPLAHMRDEKVPKDIRKHGERCGVPEEQISSVIERVRDGLALLSPGEELVVPETGTRLFVGKADSYHEIHTRPGAILRLVAKIAYEVLVLTLTFEQLEQFSAELAQLRDCARHGTTPPIGLICMAPWLTDEKYFAKRADYLHRVVVEWEDAFVRVRIAFFHNVTYLVYLFRHDKREINHPSLDGRSVLGAGFGMTFRPGDETKGKYLGIRTTLSDDWETYEVPEL